MVLFFLKNLWNILQYYKEQSSYKADVPSDHPLVRHLSHVTSEANSQFLDLRHKLHPHVSIIIFSSSNFQGNLP